MPDRTPPVGLPPSFRPKFPAPPPAAPSPGFPGSFQKIGQIDPNAFLPQPGQPMTQNFYHHSPRVGGFQGSAPQVGGLKLSPEAQAQIEKVAGQLGEKNKPYLMALGAFIGAGLLLALVVAITRHYENKRNAEIELQKQILKNRADLSHLMSNPTNY